MNTFIIRIYVLFIASFFVAYSNTTAPLHTTTTQSNHLSANPANGVIQTYGTMAKLSYPHLVHNEGKIHSKSTPVDLNHVYVLYSDDYQGPYRGTGSILRFKLDPSKTKITEIKVISAAHVYQPLFTGGLTGKEYLTQLEGRTFGTSSILISNKWLATGDPSGVITPAVINPSKLTHELRGWNIDSKYITNVEIPKNEMIKRDIIVVTYSSETGLNSEMLSDEWKEFIHYKYNIKFIVDKSPLPCEVNCPIKFAGFGVEGQYQDSTGHDISQPTIFSLDTPQYAYYFDKNNEYMEADVKNLVAEKLDPYTEKPMTKTQDINYHGYSGSTALIPGEVLGIAFEVQGTLFSTAQLRFVPFQTQDSLYLYWLLANVSSA